jgi:3-oxoacyl-[acyl-carrier protein] reductase
VNISSIASIVTRAGLSAYSASKAALSSLTRTTALEYAGDNILVNAVCPAYTDTAMLQNLDDKARLALLDKVPLKRFAQPEDVAEMVSFLLSDKNNFITGQNMILDGGVTIQ